MGILNWIIATPVLFIVLLMVLPASLAKWGRPLLLVQTLVSLALGLYLWNRFDPQIPELQFSEYFKWLPQWGLYYFVGIDGISLPLVLLTAVISPIAVLGTWPHAGHEPKNEKFFLANVMALQMGMYGTFLAMDLFLFYVYWEVVLIPMFFMIGIWGGQERIYASVKFFLYTMVGSLLMLVAILYMAYTASHAGVDAPASMVEVMKMPWSFDGHSMKSLLASEQTWLFLAFALAFVIKVPMVPFHTWLPDAHVQAPTLGSVFLAAVLLKMGTYGLMRLAIPAFPQAAYYFSDYFIALGIIGVIYGAFCALSQDDFKKLVAYSSVSHMGFIVMGLFSFQQLAIAGSLYQMVNHGISSAGLFLIVGFLYERLHTRDLNAFGNLAKTVPMMAVAFMLLTLSSVGLPGTNGFVGEFIILLGTFQVKPWAAALAGTGVIFGAIYGLRAYQKVMLGPVTKAENSLIHDLNGKEIISMVALAFFIFSIGFFPKAFFGKSDSTLEQYSKNLISKVKDL